MSTYEISQKEIAKICDKSVSGSNPHRLDIADKLRQDTSESRRSAKISLEELDSETAQVLCALTDRIGASALSVGFRIRTVTAYGASEVTETRKQLVIQGKNFPEVNESSEDDELPEVKEWFEKAFPLDQLSAEQMAAAMKVCHAITKSQQAIQSSPPKINGYKLEVAVRPYDKNPRRPHFIQR